MKFTEHYERQVLGSCLGFVGSMQLAFAALTPEMFSKPAYQASFAMLVEEHANQHPSDLVNITQAFISQPQAGRKYFAHETHFNEWRKVLPVYLTQLVHEVVGTANLEYNLFAVLEAYIRREVIQVAERYDRGEVSRQLAATFRQADRDCLKDLEAAARYFATDSDLGEALKGLLNLVKERAQLVKESRQSDLIQAVQTIRQVATRANKNQLGYELETLCDRISRELL